VAAEPWWENEGWRPELFAYAVLINAFVLGRLGPDEFEVLYLTIFKNDPTIHAPERFAIIDALFGDVDSYCSDDDLRLATKGIDEEELRGRARAALDELRRIDAPGG
jgi:hypothetical protein